MVDNQKYDAVIVLGNLMDKHGILNQESSSRVDTAVSILRQYQIPLLVTCGWAYRTDSSISIAAAMKQYVIERFQISEATILTETNSRDTVGDAVFTKRNLAIPKHWSRISLVTSAYHAERSRTIFSFVYGSDFRIDVFPAPSERNADLQKAEACSMVAFRATFDGVSPGDDKAIFECLRTRHPFYNGQIHPVITELD